MGFDLSFKLAWDSQDQHTSKGESNMKKSRMYINGFLIACIAFVLLVAPMLSVWGAQPITDSGRVKEKINVKEEQSEWKWQFKWDEYKFQWKFQLKSLEEKWKESMKSEEGKMHDGGFTHGIKVWLDGEFWYFIGPPDGMNDAMDIPGHYWVMAGHHRLVGKHYNTGPYGAPQWWSSDAEDGELLYIVPAVIDIWTPMKSEWYAERGFIHYHELVNVETGEYHPNKIVWLKHIARTSFTLDGGPHPEFGAHYVTPGIDLEFLPNYWVPYEPEIIM